MLIWISDSWLTSFLHSLLAYGIYSSFPVLNRFDLIHWLCKKDLSLDSMAYNLGPLYYWMISYLMQKYVNSLRKESRTTLKTYPIIRLLVFSFVIYRLVCTKQEADLFLHHYHSGLHLLCSAGWPVCHSSVHCDRSTLPNLNHMAGH